MKTATITKAQVLKLAADVKALVRTEGGSYTDRLEEILLSGYDNVVKNNFGSVDVILKGGNHVDLYEII
jgi:hypothetical protein